ncbi:MULTISPECIES: AraC family transcriptional regulator [Pedobacter]|uniref:AraC family transcriptional regulator n=1 Tax=Pedobacter TaxID=84567 RepID=UPI001E332E29|nr:MULTISPECIES: AraC family transcriptional regulator [Pedobacter]
MKPALEYLPSEPNASFVSRKFEYDYFPTPWHFHPEYEIVLVTESTGKRVIGNQISRFEPGDLALLGPYLPHTYQNDEIYHQSNKALRASSIVVHFRDSSFGEGFLSLPETYRIQTLLKNSVRGINVRGIEKQKVSIILHELIHMNGLGKWLKLVEILDLISRIPSQDYICSQALVGQNQKESHRMNHIINFVLENFRNEISVPALAKSTGMSTTSFSRYFSNRTRKPFTAFVNEVRLNHVSKLLMETTMSITEIWLDSGFNSLSNFNRQFKTMYGYNPLTFRKQFQVS